MKIYRDSRRRFQIELPDGWSRIGFLRGILRGSIPDPDNPEFTGSKGEQLKFAIGPISPEPTVSEQQERMKAIAQKHGHRVYEVDSIEVDGKEHAVVHTCVPLGPYRDSPQLLLKNYHLIFNNFEYLITASLVTRHPGRGVRGIIRHGDEEVYDQIVKSFRAF